MPATSQSLGKAFETLINDQNKAYKKAGLADIEQTTAKIRIEHRGPGGRVRGRAKKGNVDFVGSSRLIGGRKIVFDAKSTKGDRFPLKNIKNTQMTALVNQAGAGGAIAFVLVEFSELERYFVAPLAWLKPWWDAWWEGEFTGDRAPASIPLREFEKAAIEVTRQGKRLDYLESVVKIA